MMVVTLLSMKTELLALASELSDGIHGRTAGIPVFSSCGAVGMAQLGMVGGWN